jgi:uncharacterized protein involved in exopolysaccharide biosynthesis
VASSRPSAPAADEDLPYLGDLQALTSNRSVDTQVEILSSADLLEQAYASLPDRIREEGFGERAVPDWAYRISRLKDTDVISVSARAHTPAAAASLANGIVSAYFDRGLRQNSEFTRQAREFAGSKLADVGRDLSGANIELSRFKQSTPS